MKKILLITIISFFTYGCHDINSGIVIRKDINASYYQTNLMPILSGKTTILIPVTYFYPESYSIDLKNKNKKGKEVIKTFYVDKQVWDTIKINSFQYFDNGCIELPYTEK